MSDAARIEALLEEAQRLDRQAEGLTRFDARLSARVFDVEESRAMRMQAAGLRAEALTCQLQLTLIAPEPCRHCFGTGNQRMPLDGSPCRHCGGVGKVRPGFLKPPDSQG